MQNTHYCLSVHATERSIRPFHQARDAMSSEENNLIDFGSERGKRIHDLHDKRLNEMRSAFEQALPLNAAPKKRRSKAKKKR